MFNLSSDLFSAFEILWQAAKKFGVEESKISLKQDEDVLDTW